MVTDSDYPSDLNRDGNRPRIPANPDHLQFPDPSAELDAPEREITDPDEAQEWVVPQQSAAISADDARRITNDDRLVKGNSRGMYRFKPTGYVGTAQDILEYVKGYDAAENSS